MKYDCGALAAVPRQSPIFRFISNPPAGYTRSHAWPEHIQQEATAFISTPGISRLWILSNLNIGDDRKLALQARNPEWVEIGKRNHLTATYDDAINYCKRGALGTKMPFWAVPFFLEDIKNKIGEAEITRRWGSARWAMRYKDFLEQVR